MKRISFNKRNNPNVKTAIKLNTLIKRDYIKIERTAYFKNLGYVGDDSIMFNNIVINSNGVEKYPSGVTEETLEFVTAKDISDVLKYLSQLSTLYNTPEKRGPRLLVNRENEMEDILISFIKLLEDE